MPGPLNACGTKIQTLAAVLESNSGAKWESLLGNLKASDIPDHQKTLGEQIVSDGRVIATNILIALRDNTGKADSPPDVEILRQYVKSLAVESRRLAAWRDAAGRRPLSPIRTILDLFEQQLVQLNQLKAIVDCLDGNALPESAPPAAASRPSQRVSPKLDDEDAEHVVMLVHGIRTEAHWQELVAGVIMRAGVATAQPVKYGYFDLFRFLVPGTMTRYQPINRLHREVRDILRTYPKAKLTVIAHSFGTYAICRLLEEFPDLTLHRLILCGSVVPADYRWDRIREQVQNRVINECGTADVWPRLAAVSTWGYGATGSVGFGTGSVRDRFHPGKHSDFFCERFVTVHWVPFILYGDIPATDMDDSRRPSPRSHRLLSHLPIRWFVVAAMLVSLALILGFGMIGVLSWLGQASGTVAVSMP
jgi:pimeloyl-ACP methyl ester carboxylesterase